MAPTFELQQCKRRKMDHSASRNVRPDGGRCTHIAFASSAAACVDQVSLKDEKGNELKTQWKLAKADEVEVTIPLESAKNSGSAHLTREASWACQRRTIALHFMGSRRN